MKKIILCFLFLFEIVLLNAQSRNNEEFEVVPFDKNNKEMSNQLCCMIDEDEEIQEQSKMGPNGVLITNSDVIICRTKDISSHVCGFMVLQSDGWINNLGVHKDYRGCGIAKRLLDEAEQITQKQGNEELKLMVYGSNDKAIRAYQKSEFKFDDRATCYTGSLCRMTKKMVYNTDLSARCAQFAAIFNEARAKSRENEGHLAKASGIVDRNSIANISSLLYLCTRNWLSIPENESCNLSLVSVSSIQDKDDIAELTVSIYDDPMKPKRQ